jgi:hypothetical protein
MERVGGFEEEGAVGSALHDPASVRCGGIIIGNTDPDRMLKGGLRAGKIRGEGANGGFQARHEAAPRETLPRAARIKVAASRRDSQKSPTRIGENAPDLPGKWGVSALKLWAVFAPRKSALKDRRLAYSIGDAHRRYQNAHPGRSVHLLRDARHACRCRAPRPEHPPSRHWIRTVGTIRAPCRISDLRPPMGMVPGGRPVLRGRANHP